MKKIGILPPFTHSSIVGHLVRSSQKWTKGGKRLRTNVSFLSLSYYYWSWSYYSLSLSYHYWLGPYHSLSLPQSSPSTGCCGLFEYLGLL